MRSHAGPTTAQLLATFTDEVKAHQGRVTDTADDGRRLLARSVLPGLKDVRLGDRLQGGVALRAVGGEVWVHPYLFRLVCQNGAIVARTVGTRHLVGLEASDPRESLQAVREAVAACCDPDVFADTFDRVRTASETAADFALTMMPMLSRLAALGASHLMERITDQFFRDGDLSQFGLANAVTATARETRDPDLRWNLEEFGGGIAVGGMPPTPGPTRSAARREVLAGAAS
ncbi:hypothetical protein [Fimbriiglobus ruber]|uniref:DUF932 domain-containing protein n=1 Tax=Fimbriiglobus ruber TaxID=1908690 RepID=A0A225E1U2_9BACT|nr:hypothetical protein [Fimbriiglobus ruber]OWK42337.1 hypothetical protein FRUB_04415 [Fimbriiglobus ruber]